MADSYPIRPVSADELDALRHAIAHAFNGGQQPPERVEMSRRLFEAERSLAAFDPAASSATAGSATARPGDVVGTAGTFSFQMAVPGAVLPVAGVTMVAVLPTHRRRGVARSLMTRQLHDIAGRGEEPIAALWASEAMLYGRYGYGPATTVAWLSVGRGEGALAVPADPSLSPRLVPPATAVTELARVYDAVLPRQPGFFARDARWWERVVMDLEPERGGFGPLRCLLVSDAAGPRGYALYSAQGGWDEAEFLPESKIAIRELVASDPAASAALWRDLLSRDLVSGVSAKNRPPDDPLLWQLADPRRARPQVSDGVWVRVIDLPRALRSRSYSCPVDAVLEVSDELLPANAGRWRLRAGAGEVTCERTTDAPDVALGISELGAAYLGGTRLGTLAAAGLVSESRPGALAPLSAAMSWDPAPWCPMIF